MTGAERIIVALDSPDRSGCEAMLRRLKPEVRFVKLGSILFTQEGPAIVRWLVDQGVGVFLDLKFHDIPNTVEGSVAAACRIAPLSFLTVHAAGGAEMVRAARKAIDASSSSPKPKLLAVTVLTSLNPSHLEQIGFGGTPPADLVERLAELAVGAGADGIVCSPREVSHLRSVLPPSVCLVVPGIRTETEMKDDQERTAGAGTAVRAGATHLVIGRPITGAADPRKAFLHFVQEAETK